MLGVVRMNIVGWSEKENEKKDYCTLELMTVLTLLEYQGIVQNNTPISFLMTIPE
jgi:hypothetical protein